MALGDSIAIAYMKYKKFDKYDFKKFHNLDVDELDGLAIMADTDNSKKNQFLIFKIFIFQQIN